MKLHNLFLMIIFLFFSYAFGMEPSTTEQQASKLYNAIKKENLEMVKLILNLNLVDINNIEIIKNDGHHYIQP